MLEIRLKIKVRARALALILIGLLAWGVCKRSSIRVLFLVRIMLSLTLILLGQPTQGWLVWNSVEVRNLKQTPPLQ